MSVFFQETMTEPSVYAEDVSKLKDADELKQACIGLKDTNRYFVPACSPPSLQVVTFPNVEFSPISLDIIYLLS